MLIVNNNERKQQKMINTVDKDIFLKCHTQIFSGHTSIYSYCVFEWN